MGSVPESGLYLDIPCVYWDIQGFDGILHRETMVDVFVFPHGDGMHSEGVT